MEGEDGRKKVPRPLSLSLHDTAAAPVTALKRNDHPYFFTNDVEHLVLWKLGAEAVSEEDICAALTRLQQEQKPAIKPARDGEGGGENQIQQQQQQQQTSLPEGRSYRTNFSYTSFQNPPSLMSIPEVQHAHILVQRGRGLSPSS